MLSRDTEWRQGSVLTHQHACDIGMFNVDTTNRHAVVISHDCDLPNDREAVVEVVIGSIILKPDPSFARARNIRCLHLVYATHKEHSICLELTHAARQIIPKQDFGDTLQPDKNFIILPDEKRALKQWLAARYGRPAFPTTFENRLREKKVEEKLKVVLERASTYIVGVYFDLGENRTEELYAGIPYVLRILIVYDAVEGGITARKAGEKAASEISALFYKAYGSPDIACELALESCEAVADTHISHADLRKLDQWRLEYISLRENPMGKFLDIGKS